MAGLRAVTVGEVEPHRAAAVCEDRVEHPAPRPCEDPMTDGTTRAPAAEGTADRLYARLVSSEVHDPDEVEALPGDADQHVAHNAVHTVGALTLTKIGDRIVDAKTVLTWLLGALGAPSALTGLLVPVRESGALLPQVLVARFVAGRPRRQPTWLVGALGQAAAVAAMAAIAFTLTGVAAGVALVLALAVFATFRSVCSLTIKDVMGRTIPTGERGQVTGWATTASGLVAITVGVGIRALGQDAGTAVFGGLLVGAAVLWVASAGVFLRVREPAVPDDTDAREGVAASLRLLVDDQPFRRFVIARTLLLVSALTPPYVVILAQQATGSDVAGLGPYVIASGVASLVGGRLWGPFADRSSRRLVAFASGAASVFVLAVPRAARAGRARRDLLVLRRHLLRHRPGAPGGPARPVDLRGRPRRHRRSHRLRGRLQHGHGRPAAGGRRAVLAGRPRRAGRRPDPAGRDRADRGARLPVDGRGRGGRTR